jgi:ribosomal-protein-alanine N-acetyltransferase
LYIKLKHCIVRSYRPSDAESISQQANNKKIWLNLRDLFPHPYTTEDANAYIQRVLDSDPETSFAICVGEDAVGGIAYRLHSDVERLSAEIGYWLGESYWGKGIVTEALKAVTAHAIDSHGLIRIFAVPFETNIASIRVRKSAIKDGKILDQLLYAFVV